MNQRCGAAVYVLENKKTPASCEIEDLIETHLSSCVGYFDRAYYQHINIRIYLISGS